LLVHMTQIFFGVERDTCRPLYYSKGLLKVLKSLGTSVGFTAQQCDSQVHLEAQGASHTVLPTCKGKKEKHKCTYIIFQHLS